MTGTGLCDTYSINTSPFLFYEEQLLVKTITINIDSVNIINDQFKTYRKNPSVVCTELDEGAVLLNLDTKYYFNLNETGLRIWQIVEDSLNPMEIAEKLAREYDVDAETARASVLRLLGELEKEELIISAGKEQ